MAHGLIKWILRKQTGLNGSEKREEANLQVVCRKDPWESRIEKGPRKPKENKQAKDAQEGNGTQEPVNNVRKGLVNALSHWEGNKQQVQRGLAGLSQTTLQQEQQSDIVGNANKATK